MKKVALISIVLSLVIGISAHSVELVQEGVTRTQLDNGLTVISKEIHTSPVVYLSVWYRVGSRNEEEGISGISHALEHMMFKGTKNHPVPGETDEMVRRIGGVGNAGTSTDYTVYYEAVPTGMEDVVIGIEADRMVNALMRDEDFQTEIKVVMEERKMRNEDSPTGLFWEELNAAAFKVHPYGRPIIGWMSDLEVMTGARLREYYASHYAPNNAIVVVCGDFETEEMMGKIKETFGKAKREENPPPMALVEPEQKVQKRIFFSSDKSNLAHVVYSWHTPTYGHEDSPTLEVVDSILSSGRQSRLQEDFVDAGLAGSADATHDTNTDPYLFYIEVELQPGVDTDTVEQKIKDEVEKLKTEPVSDYELQKAKNRFRAEQTLHTQSISTYGRILGWFEISTGDPEFWDKYLVQIDTVTADDVMRVAKEYFTDMNLTAGVMVPAEGAASSAAPGVVGPAQEYGYVTPDTPAPAQAETVSLDSFPPIDFSSRVKEFTLDNGLTLMVYENHAFPVVAVHGVVRGGGSYSDPAGKSGMAKLAARTMRRGTKTRTYDEINEALEFVGAGVEFSAGNESAVFSGEFLEKDSEMGLEIMSDMLVNPAFRSEDLEMERGVAQAELAAMQKSNRTQAWRAYMSQVYAGHPYSNPVDGTEEDLASVSAEDLAAFHESAYRPDRTIIAVSGDVDANATKELVEKLLKDWKAPDNEAFSVPEPPVLSGQKSDFVDMPEKMQDVFVVGFSAPRPTDPDYTAFEIMTDVLAGTDLTSRLYTSVREAEGLVYYVYGFDLPKTAASTFQISGGLAPENLDRALELVKQEITRISTEPLSEQELADAKSFAVGRLPMSIETNDSIASVMADFKYQGRPLSDIDNYAETVRSITAQDIMDAAKKYLATDNYALGVAGPK